MCFISVHVVHPYISMDTVTAWKKSCFILLNRSNFHMINDLSIAFHTFARHMMTLISVDEMLLPRYVNCSTIFRSLSLRMAMASFLFKTHVLCFICIHIEACCRLLGIMFGLVYLQGALGHHHSLYLSSFLLDIVCLLPFLM